VSLGKEVVRIHACGEHRGERTSALVGLDRRGKHDHVGGDLDLLVLDQIGRLNGDRSVGLGIDLADHALYVVDAVFLDRAAVELVEVLSGGTHVNVEHINLGVWVFFTHEHCVLCGVHTADLRAVRLSAAGGIAAADALNENDRVRMSSVGGTEQRARRGTCGVRETLELERGHNVLGLSVSELAEFVKLDRIVSGRRDDRAVLFLDHGVLLRVVDRSRGAYLRAYAALAVLQHIAVIGIDDRNLRHCLGKRNVDRAAVVHSEVELVGDLLLRTFFGAETAARALRLIDESRLAAYLYGEVSDESGDRLDFAV